MTELEQKALLGDKQAQRECTEKGILLPCPFCGGDAIIEYDTINPFEYAVFCGDCGVMTTTAEEKKIAIKEWNTRHASPVVRCKDCTCFYEDRKHGNVCEEIQGLREPESNDFCSYGEPKDGEQGAAD